MKPFQSEFLQLCLTHGILRFGEFELKSGRISPYFFNAGLFNQGALLAAAGCAYAALLNEKVSQDFVLYGPAYKGIPLAAVTALQLHANHHRNIPYAFNRKEAKDHGEGGLLVGAEMKGDIVVIDDVITAGTSVRESVNIIQQHGARLHAVIIALDRQEAGTDDNRSAVQVVEQTLGVPVYSILKLDDLIQHVNDSSDAQTYRQQMLDYQEQYGINHSADH